MKVNIAESWGKLLAREFQQPYFEALVAFVRTAYQHYEVYPPAKEIFRAFSLCSFEETKVVILGQDPYHSLGQANGLCFSVRDNVPTPPSLVNIFTEIHNDLGIAMPPNGNLERWATQGVLLLNATLTVQAGKPGSHQNKGWERFTDAVISTLSHNKEHSVFLLWGAYAQQKTALIDDKKHLILKSSHPSPYSANRGFFGNQHFSKANAYLEKYHLKAIQW
ncbi:MAG: uracil-DNA glycosylase [Amoebophilaceae bacterium]|jgi:uracil-DNA glycosylase|nr:uracil-DNA glycosylase [Amoebophilaceae bacterium]